MFLRSHSPFKAQLDFDPGLCSSVAGSLSYDVTLPVPACPSAAGH